MSAPVSPPLTPTPHALPEWKVCTAQPRLQAHNFNVFCIFFITFHKSLVANSQTNFQSGRALSSRFSKVLPHMDGNVTMFLCILSRNFMHA